MNEQEKNVTNGTEGTQQQEPNQATQQQPTATQQTQQEPVKKTGGFVNWLKAHWKGVTGGIVAAGVTATSAVLAYRKGKAASGYTQQTPQEDYDLNPNND